MTAVPWGSQLTAATLSRNQAAQATAAVTQAHVRLDATERVVASVQLEVSRVDDEAQSARRAGPPQKIYDGQRVLFEAGPTPCLTL